jgi:hypothetical protein
VSAEPVPRVIPLRYAGTCASCASALARGTKAWWDGEKKQIVCVACRPVTSGGDAEASPPTVLTTVGVAGASALREGERRRDNRERRTLGRHPHIGKLVLALSDEPQSISAWSKGAVGERALGAKLSELADERVVVLHDRRIPASRSNIDHIVVSAGSVFVIDAKHYGGQVEKRNLGNIFRPDVRLYVGHRDCTKLVHGAEDQAEVVRDILAPLGLADVPVRPVLCFLGADWGFFPTAFKLGHVLISYPKFLYDLVGKPDAEVETAAIQHVARELVDALPAAATAS